MRADVVDSPLSQPERLPVMDPGAVDDLGPTLVIAPHPDDETLGCGGLIALLSARDIPVRVLVMSDGTGSHRASRRYPPERLRALRQREALDAVALLAHPRRVGVAFLNLPDEHVPSEGSANFDDAVSRCEQSIGDWHSVPSTVVVPWRRDPHCDHRASWQITRSALRRMSHTPRTLEYPVWVTEFGRPDDYPRHNEMRAWLLDITAVRETKLAAIGMHRSQTTDLIDDDPSGFRLTDATLRRFGSPWELYLEAVND